MTKSFTGNVWQEDDWFVAQCLEVDVASQGNTEDEALANLAEDLALYFEPPAAEKGPLIRRLEVEVSGS